MMVGTLIILFLLVYTYQDKLASFFLNRGAVSKSSNPSTTTNQSGSTSNTKAPNNETVLKRGDRGSKVEELQKLLNKEHDYQSLHGTKPSLAKLTEDGIFGAKTEALLKSFTGKTAISINQLLYLLQDQKTGVMAAVDFNLN